MALTRADVDAALRDMIKSQRSLMRYADKSTDVTLRAFVRAQQRLYDKITSIITDAPSMKSLSMNQRLAWYVQNKAALDRAMHESGYSNIVTRYVNKYDSIAKLVSQGSRNALVNESFVTIPDGVINAISREHFTQFEFLNQQARAALHRTLLNSTIAGHTNARALSELRGLITGRYPWGERTGLYEWHAGTYTRTAHMQSARAFNENIAHEAGLEQRIYVGPFDNKTRPFCQEFVGAVMTVIEIEELDNGQTGDVLTTGGGWNCRHQWIAIDNEFAAILKGEFERDAIQSSMNVA